MEPLISGSVKIAPDFDQVSERWRNVMTTLLNSASKSASSSAIAIGDQARRIIEAVEKDMVARPKVCMFPVLDLKPGEHYTPLAEPCKIRANNLIGLAAEIWAQLGDREKLLSYALSPAGEDGKRYDQFQIILHREHGREILCGRRSAFSLTQTTAEQVRLLADLGVHLKLVFVHAGNKPDDASYRLEVSRMAVKMGIAVEAIQVSENPTPEELRILLEKLNADPSVSGVMVQTIRDKECIKMIRQTLDPGKDPECITNSHMSEVILAAPGVEIGAPSTALACLRLIRKACGSDLRGKRVVILNDSEVVGRPLAMLLQAEGASSVMNNKFTPKAVLKSDLSMADVFVTATGVRLLERGIVAPEDFKPGVVIIDVGIIEVDGPKGKHIVGDLDVEPFRGIAGKMTPVPGGVGVVTSSIFLYMLVHLWIEAHKASLVQQAS